MEPTHALQTPSKPPSKSLQQEEEEIIQSRTSSSAALVTTAPETNKTGVSLHERLHRLETMVESLVQCREPSLGSLPNQQQQLQQQQLQSLQDAVQWQDHQVSGWLDQLEVVLETKDQQYAALVHRMDALEQSVSWLWFQRQRQDPMAEPTTSVRCETNQNLNNNTRDERPVLANPEQAQDGSCETVHVRTAATGQCARMDLSLPDRVNRLEWTVIASAILYSAWILLWKNHSSWTVS